MSEVSQPRRLAATRLPSVRARDVSADERTWDVRALRYIDDVGAARIAAHFLNADGHDPSSRPPRVIGAGPVVSRDWLGAVRVARIPVRVLTTRGAADGYVEVMPVGAGTSEVRLCLRGNALIDRARGWRRLQQLAERACDALMRVGAGPHSRATQADSHVDSRHHEPNGTRRHGVSNSPPVSVPARSR